MSASDKAQLGDHESRVDAIEAELPSGGNALETHKTSADHDGRYFTETESDGRFAPISHVGSGGGAHSVATASESGFMNSADKTQLGDHESRIDTMEADLPGKAEDADVTAVQDNLDTHKTSADHDARYYTETEIDTMLNSYRPYYEVDVLFGSSDLADWLTSSNAKSAGIVSSPKGGFSWSSSPDQHMDKFSIPVRNVTAGNVTIPLFVARATDILCYQIDAGSIVTLISNNDANVEVSVAIPTGDHVVSFYIIGDTQTTTTLMIADWFTADVVYNRTAGYGA